MKKRVLIVYENMGMGHRRMARILGDILQADASLEVTSVAGSDLLGSTSVNAIVATWNCFIRKNWIRAVDLLINFFTRIVLLPVLEISDAPKLWKQIEALTPDLIISTADGFNKVLGEYASAHGIPFYIVITDISIFADLVSPHATHVCYFPGTARAVNSYDFGRTYFSRRLTPATSLPGRLRYVLDYWRDHILHPRSRSVFRHAKGLLPRRNNARTLVIGPLAERKHFQPKDRAAIRGRLGLPEGVANVLIASGSIGGRFLHDTAKALCKNCTQPVNLLFMCGRDKASHEACLRLTPANAGVNVIPYEYVDNFDEFLAVADCVVARPSAGIFIESLLNRVPTIALGDVPSNDKGSLAIIEEYGVGEICQTPDGLSQTLESVLQDRARYIASIDNLLANVPPSFNEKAALLLAEVRNALGDPAGTRKAI